MHYCLSSLATALALLGTSDALKWTQPNLKARHADDSHLLKRQLPANATGVKTLVTPQNITIRYKEPGKDGVCETTPGVNSYSGYIDLDADHHTFFWFFEARHDPQNAPVTLWLNGGPGSDSLIGLFQELGPCHVTANLTTELNPYAWNEVSNLLFLSQPFGVGFSYEEEVAGSQNTYTQVTENASYAGVAGRYPVIDATAIDTTKLAAVAAWHVLQGFLGALPQLDSPITSKIFNLWTESYGGHYGPAFYDYFYEQNKLIANGTHEGIELNFNSLGIINGIINEAIQAEYYPEFAVNNTYGIRSINDTVYSYMKFANFMIDGCLDQIGYCESTNKTEAADFAICSEAASMCRDNVEGPYYSYGNRGVYDIRHPYDDPTPPEDFINYLNQATVQNSLGTNLNYSTDYNDDVYYAFQQTGDFIFNDFLEDLEQLLNAGLRVSLIYGDADYICNWFGGEAVSKQVNYTHTAEFNAAGYAPFLVDGTEYGEVRQYGNFSFTRVYESGHEVPYYQPVAALELFRRTLQHLDLATGEEALTPTYESNGTAKATHTNSFVPLPSSTSTAAAAASSSSAAGAIPIVRPRWATGKGKWRM